MLLLGTVPRHRWFYTVSFSQTYILIAERCYPWRGSSARQLSAEKYACATQQRIRSPGRADGETMETPSNFPDRPHAVQSLTQPVSRPFAPWPTLRGRVPLFNFLCRVHTPSAVPSCSDSAEDSPFCNVRSACARHGGLGGDTRPRRRKECRKLAV